MGVLWVGRSSVKGYAYVYGYVARCGATFAAQLIKQVERKLLIVCAERQLEKNFHPLSHYAPGLLLLSTGDRYDKFTAICCCICFASQAWV